MHFQDQWDTPCLPPTACLASQQEGRETYKSDQGGRRIWFLSSFPSVVLYSRSVNTLLKPQATLASFPTFLVYVYVTKT